MNRTVAATLVAAALAVAPAPHPTTQTPTPRPPQPPRRPSTTRTVAACSNRYGSAACR